MKTCSKCKVAKPLNLYTRNSSKKDGLNHNCRDCQRQYTRDHYRANRTSYLARTQLNREQYIQDHNDVLAPLKAGPCTDCGNCFPACAMDFDHLDALSKKRAIADLVRSACSKETLLAEIGKCELVCANCHRVRTQARRIAASQKT